MDRRRAAGALLALAACIACATAAPTASNQTALDLYDSDTAEGCYYNFQHYGEGERIMTNEPCLNCTCHNRMLMCYLRVCPFTKPIGQDCTVEKRADQCCPIVTCPDVPVDLLTSTPTTSPAEYGTTGVGRLDKYGCSINGKYFPEGSKVPPSPNKPCEHCYCIRNMTTCVMQECTLHVDGCTPIYHKEVCCPIRYSCDHEDEEIPMLDDMTTTVRPTPGFLLTTTTVASVTQIPQECVHEDKIFPDGALIKTEKACEHCYCMKGDIVCVVQECGTPMENEGKNCTSLAPREGQCCPDTYICEGDEVPTELPTELPAEVATAVQKEAATEEPTEMVTEAQRESPTELPTEESTEKQKEYSTEEPKEATTQISTADVTKGQKEVITEVPEDVTTLVPTEDVTDKLKETETPIGETSEVQKESITEQPSVKTTEVATEEVTEQQKEPSTEESQEATTQAVTGDVNQVHNEATTELPKETVTDYATDAAIYATVAVTEAEVDSVSVTETEGSGEIATESTIEESEPATQAPKDTTTEITTQTTGKAATEASTHAASEVAPDEPTQEPTTFIPPRRTSVEGSGYRNEPDEFFTESPFLEETEGSGDEERTEKPSGVKVTPIPIEETTSPVGDFESEITTAKDTSIYSSSRTEPTISHSEQTTTEPDKGENTVPSDDILPSIFDETHSEAPATIQASKETTSIVDQKTESPLEEKIGEKPAVTTPEAITLAFTESVMTTEIQSITSRPVLEDEKVTETTVEIITSKEPADITTDKSDASETIAPMTEKVELDIQTTVSFDEKESKSTTVQLPDTPSEAETVKQEKVTTEAVQEYTTSENKIKDQDLYTTVQPAIEAVITTILASSVPETTSINPLENEIHEEGTPSLTPGVIPGEGNCLLDGITYNNDSTVPTSHKCQSSCKCVSSIVKCEEIMCSPEPENMGICKAVYESEESCCPYYTCDQAKETPPLKAHSQMSGTELPMTQDHCDGESCNNQDEQTPPLAPTKEKDVIQPEVCSDGKCISPPKDCSGDSCQLPSRKDCANDGTCDVYNQEACAGSNCDTTFVKDSLEPAQDNTQDCANPEDCKSSSPDITKSTCEGDECTLIKQDCSSGKCETIPVEIPVIPDVQKQEACGGESDCKITVQSQEPQPECTDETCIKKDVKDIKDKPSSVCSDDSCVQQKITPSSEIGLLSTELPESIDKIQTELPSVIETETEKQITSDFSVTVPEEMTETPQLATYTHEVGVEMPEATTAGQAIEVHEITTKTAEITEPQDISTDTPKISIVPESQEVEKTTIRTEIEQSHTESTVAELPETHTTATSESEITTARDVTEEGKPEDVIHMQDTESPVETSSLETRIETTEPTVMETSAPTKVVDETTESDISKLTTVTEKEEINTVLPEVGPSFGEPEVIKLPEESVVTESQTEQPMEEKPAFTEVLPESPVTESQNDFITGGDNNVDVGISRAPEDKQDVTMLPEQVTEIPEAVTETKTEQSIQDEIVTKPHITTVETTMRPFSDEEAFITEGPKEPALEPQEPITELPVIPIMDDKDNTESPIIDTKKVTTPTPDQTPAQDKESSTEGPESITTEFHDVYTKTPEMPLSEEQVKHTVITVAPVTESQDSEQTVDQERTTTSVYSVTEPQTAVTEKDADISITETQETESKTTETLPSEEQEKETEHPITENEEIATETPQEKVTISQESPVTKVDEITTKVSQEQGVVTDVPVSPVTNQENVGTAAPEAPISEDKEKHTEAPITSVPEVETKSPEMAVEQDVSTKEPALSFTEPQDSVTIAPEHPVKDDEKSTESPAMLPQGTEKQDISTELSEVPTTESQKADTEVPKILVPNEEEKSTEVPKLVTEFEEVVTEAPAKQPAGEQEAPVTQHQESITEVSKIPEEPTTEVDTKSHEEVEPAITKVPEIEELTTTNVETEQSEYEKPTKGPEIVTKAPAEQDIKTENPLALVTEQQELYTSPDEQQHIKHDEPESPVTQTQESVTDSVELVTSKEEEKHTEIPETESQDTFSTTTLPLSGQDTQTVVPEKTITDNQDTITQYPEVAQPEQPEHETEIPDSTVTEFQEKATKVPDAKQPDSQDINAVTSEPIHPETQAATEVSVDDITSSEPELPITEPQDLVTETPETSKPGERLPYTNAPESVTESRETSSTQAAEQEIPVTSVTQSGETSTNIPEESVKEDIEKQTMVPEFQLTEPYQIGTEAPEQHDVPKEATAAPAIESQEAFTNVPVILVPEEQPTVPPAVEAQETVTGTPQVPTQDESQPEPPVEQEPIVPEEPTIPGGKVTEIPERDDTEPHDIITDSPMPAVTEKQEDVSITESQETVPSVHDDKISSTDEPTTQTSQTKLDFSETTPYLVELEEHTHKIEIVTSTAISEDVSAQATEAYEKPKEPSTEIEEQTEEPVTTEKTMKVSSVEPTTNAPTTLQEYAITESKPQEQSTPKSDVDDTRRTTMASEEIDDKVPEEEVSVPIIPVTEKEFVPTTRPEADTEKYSTAQTTAKPMEATSSQEVSSEEDSHPLTTTLKSADEVTTQASIDKATTAESKPTELPSPIPQETVKPTSSEEVPSEEESGQFPPSGTGYGQEPDYAEEDQAFGPGTCRYGGKVYVSAQQIPRDDPCDFCFCFRSDIICLQQSCPPPIHGCHEEPIQGFCCPRYECPVSMATTLNMTTTTTTTTTTLPPHFLTHAYNGAAQKRGCLIKGHTYKVGEVVRASSGPCLHCTCGGDGQMKCDPKVCTPEPMLRQMIAAAVSAKRRR